MNYYTLIIIVVILALAVLSILIMENNRITAEKRRLFLATNLIVLLAAIAECGGVHIGLNPNIPSSVLKMVKACDYILTPMIGGALIMICEKPGSKNGLLKCLFLGNAIFQVIAAINGWMIEIDEFNHYTHGKFYPVYIIFYVSVVISYMFKMLKYGKSFKKQNRFSLYAVVFMTLFGVAVQEIMGSQYRISYLAIAFGVVFLFIHHSEYFQIVMDETISDQQLKLSVDPLTHIGSRFAYVDAMNKYQDSIPEDFVACLIDINGLKLANDSLGHEAGDELICGAAECINNALGRYGQSFRIGGDEFVVFANMNEEQLELALNDLNKKIESWSGKLVKKLSLSIGAARHADYKELSVEDHVKEADIKMYKQKNEYYQKNNIERRKIGVQG
ncbi:MAG: GGDEF domain-containing protein [Erysipelotrichaceae bacterium]|nr:GGDEF domain-containing protein [Erysipelotrichaceae bacterium]